MQVRDISDAITWTIGQVIRMMMQGLSMLDSIRFSGISLLDFIIFLNILAVVIPLLFARLKATPHAEKGRGDKNETDN